MNKHVVALVLMGIYFCQTSFAQSADIQDVWVDHNIIQDNKKGMSVHTKFSVRGMQGEKVECLVMFYDENKNKIKTEAAGYRTFPESFAFVRSLRTPKYNASTFQDVENFLPYSVLCFKEGKHKYYFRVFIVDMDSYDLAVSDYYSFIGTGHKKREEASNIQSKVSKNP